MREQWPNPTSATIVQRPPCSTPGCWAHSVKRIWSTHFQGWRGGQCAKSDSNCQLARANTGCRLECTEQISHLGEQRLQSAQGPQIDTHTHIHYNWEGRDGPEPSRTYLPLQTEQRPSTNILPRKSGRLLTFSLSHTHTMKMKRGGSKTFIFGFCRLLYKMKWLESWIIANDNYLRLYSLHLYCIW